MTAEVAWTVKQAGYGVSTAVSIGGDALIGSSPRDLMELFQADDETKLVVYFGEPGTTFEEDLADYVSADKELKPLLCMVGGRFTEQMPEGTVFGHAASLISANAGRPSVKMRRLKEAGAMVAVTLDEMAAHVQAVLD